MMPTPYFMRVPMTYPTESSGTAPSGAMTSFGGAFTANPVVVQFGAGAQTVMWPVAVPTAAPSGEAQATAIPVAPTYAQPVLAATPMVTHAHGPPVSTLAAAARRRGKGGRQQPLMGVAMAHEMDTSKVTTQMVDPAMAAGHYPRMPIMSATPVATTPLGATQLGAAQLSTHPQMHSQLTQMPSHMPGTSSSSGSQSDALDASVIIKDKAACSRISQSLKEGNMVEHERLFEWLLPVAAKLSLEPQGCRLVQDLIDVNMSQQNKQLLENLLPHIEELYESRHGNHVLSKLIEKTPSSALAPLARTFRGKAVKVASHRFGCRVFERLIEHCPDSDIWEEVAAEWYPLSRHPFGNFVVQHLLEHSTTLRPRIVESMLPELATLAMHRTASHVVQRAIDHCRHESRAAIVATLLQGCANRQVHSHFSGNSRNVPDLLEIACSRYGSYVVEQLKDADVTGEVRRLLSDGLKELLRNQYGCRVAEVYGLRTPEMTGTFEFDQSSSADASSPHTLSPQA